MKTINTHIKGVLGKVKDLHCYDFAMHNGTTPNPCKGRLTGECCIHEQTFEEASKELKDFLHQSLLTLHTQTLKKIRGEVEKIHTEYPDLESDEYDNGNKNFKKMVLDLLDNQNRD